VVESRPIFVPPAQGDPIRFMIECSARDLDVKDITTQTSGPFPSLLLSGHSLRRPAFANAIGHRSLLCGLGETIPNGFEAVSLEFGRRTRRSRISSYL
jgi:hypothetical protein